MPNITSEKELIEHFDILLTTAARPEIAAELAQFAYDQTTLQADQTLLTQIRAAQSAQQKEQAEARAATQAEDTIQTTARAAFVQLHTLIKLADRATPALDFKHILQTHTLPQAETPFLTYTTNLLDRLQAQPDILTALSQFGFTPDRIPQLHTLLQNVRQADINQQQELNEAKQATAVYQDRITQLRLAHSILTTLLKQTNAI